MSKQLGCGALISALALTLAAAAPARAQEPGVARISIMQGEVSTQRGANGEWVAAALNAPLVNGDSLATAAGARSETELDFADTLRLSENSQATIATLTPSQIQVQVGQGLVDFVQVPGAEAAAEVDTPNLAVHPQGAGVYRIQVNSDQESVVTVRSGEAEVNTPQGSATLHAGQTITVEGSDDPQYLIAAAAPRDDWDHWNESRDHAIAVAQSWSHANRYYTGVEDLDAYGHWVYVPGYGEVWAPDQGAGWSPYSAGRWVYEPYWGWTWVSTEAWGWAPYHYGRWFFYGTSWVWWPGPVVETPRFRPVWAPAYVSFIGLRVGAVSLGVGFGSIGWVPIGPADPYRPWWGGGVAARVRITEINRVNADTNVRIVAPLAPVGIRGRVVYSNLDRITTDPHMARAVVTVPAERFGQGVVVRQTVTVNEIRQGQVMAGRLPVAPTPASRLVSGRRVDAASLPRAAVRPPAHYYGSRPAPAGGAPRPADRSQAFDRQPAPRPQTLPAPAARPESNGVSRPGFQRFGAASSAGTVPKADSRRGLETSAPHSPVAPGGTAPRGATAQQHTNDPNWHQFGPENKPEAARAPKGADSKESKEKAKPVVHDGGRG